MSQQLPLPLGLDPEFTFQRFLPGPNREAMRHLQASSRGDGLMPIFLHGPSASGKTHLLQATCMSAGEHDLLAMLLPLKALQIQGPSMIEGLEEFDCICLDDLDCIVGDMAWETAIFQLFNALYDRQARLVVTADKPPKQLPFLLQDLQSRLSMGPILGLKPLSETETIEALISHAEGIGLELSETVARYLVNRVERDLGSLLRHLDRLDRASMAAARKLTIPFVRSQLEA